MSKTTTLFTLELEADSFNSEVLKAKKNIEDLTKEKTTLQQKQKDGIVLTDEESISLTKLDGAIKANKKELNDLTSIIQKKTEADLAQQGSQKQVMALYQAAEKELKRLGGTFEKTAKGELVLTNANKENTVATNQIFQKLKEYDSLLGRHNLNVGNYGGVLTGLKQKIVELDQQRSIATDPDEVMKLTAEIRKLTLQQDQYLGKVDALGQRVAKNDIKDGFNDANSAAMALSGSIGILSLVMGTDSKAGEVLRKVMIGVTIAQTALTIAQNKADIAAFSQKVGIDRLIKSMSSLKGLLIGGFIASAAVAIGMFVKNLVSAKKATEEQIPVQEKLNDVMDRTSEIISERLGKIDELSNDETKSLQRTIDLRTAQGASEKELLNLSDRLINAQLEATRLVMGNSELFGDLTDALVAKENDLLNQLAINSAKRRKIIQAELKENFSEISILTVAEKEKLNAQLNETFLASPNIQKAFQNLLGVDDETFKQAWSQIGATIDESSVGLKGVAENEKVINNLLDEQNKKRELTLEQQEKMQQQALAFADIFSNAFSALFTTAEEKQKEFFKQSVLMLLEYLERFFEAQLAAMALKQVAEKGFIGLITSALLGGVMKATFQLAKNKISGFAEGGVVTDNHGIPIQRDNGDNRLVTVKTNEVILNEPQQQGLKQMAGADVFRKLRIPGFIGGGLVLGDGGFSSRATVSQVNNSFEVKQAIQEVMRNLPPSVVHVTSINREQTKYNTAKVVQSLNG